MGSKAPSWADQWGTTGGFDSDEEDIAKAKKGGASGNKAKAAASAGLDKAKTAALVGADKAKAAAVVSALKVKSSTSAGLKWVKNQYQKRTSSK